MRALAIATIPLFLAVSAWIASSSVDPSLPTSWAFSPAFSSIAPICASPAPLTQATLAVYPSCRPPTRAHGCACGAHKTCCSLLDTCVPDALLHPSRSLCHLWSWPAWLCPNWPCVQPPCSSRGSSPAPTASGLSADVWVCCACQPTSTIFCAPFIFRARAPWTSVKDQYPQHLHDHSPPALDHPYHHREVTLDLNPCSGDRAVFEQGLLYWLVILNPIFCLIVISHPQISDHVHQSIEWDHSEFYRSWHAPPPTIQSHTGTSHLPTHCTCLPTPSVHQYSAHSGLVPPYLKRVHLRPSLVSQCHFWFPRVLIRDPTRVSLRFKILPSLPLYYYSPPSLSPFPPSKSLGIRLASYQWSRWNSSASSDLASRAASLLPLWAPNCAETCSRRKHPWHPWIPQCRHPLARHSPAWTASRRLLDRSRRAAMLPEIRGWREAAEIYRLCERGPRASGFARLRLLIEWPSKISASYSLPPQTHYPLLTDFTLNSPFWPSNHTAS